MFGEITECSPKLGLDKRLKHVGVELLRNLLIPRCVSFMRITAAEAVNFPELASMAYQVSFQGSVEKVVRAIQPDSSKINYQVEEAARQFIELAVQPYSLQALYGADLSDLMDKSTSHINLVVDLIISKFGLSSE